ncbi:MAG: nucleotidyl transferase AbiEii/AbiGii toxin family protein [Elusimicrobiota bacterium]
MVKKTILTSAQKRFLEFFNDEKELTKEFYLTGGTALAEFYLKHRYSEDLDFFNETEEIDEIEIGKFIKKIETKFKLKEIKFRKFLGLYTYFLYFLNDEMLKIDFNYYPFPRIEKGIKYKDITVDSLYDIAVNKVHTISVQPRARDFIDVFFIVKEKRYSLHKLLMDAKAKFDWHIDAVHLGSRFYLAIEMKEYPRMIKKIDHREWQNFFVNEARKLKKEIFK